MGRTSLRIMIVETSNPHYDARLKHGWRSIERFQTGLPITVHVGGSNGLDYYSFFSDVSIDIPQLRMFGITDRILVQQLLKASAEPLNPTPPKPATPLIQLPPGETFLACAKCQGTKWLNVMRKADHTPLRSVCAQCGNVIRTVRSTHTPGHA